MPRKLFILGVIAIATVVMGWSLFLLLGSEADPARQPSLVWYQPADFGPHIATKSNHIFAESDMKSIQARYICAHEEEASDSRGSFRIIQSSLMGYSPALVQATWEDTKKFLLEQHERGHSIVLEDVKIGPFDGYYVKRRPTDIQGLQQVHWQSDTTHVQFSVDASCKTKLGNELSKEDLLSIARSMLDNSVSIYQPRLPKFIARSELFEWFERPSRGEIVWHYMCRDGYGGTFGISQKFIPDGNIRLEDKADELWEGYHEFVVSEPIVVNEKPAIYTELSMPSLSSQALLWQDGAMLMAIASLAGCDTKKKDLLRTAESVVPLPPIYFPHTES